MTDVWTSVGVIAGEWRWWPAHRLAVLKPLIALAVSYYIAWEAETLLKSQWIA